MFQWRKSVRKTVSLALQGGGAHGAFVWGVLDRLLEDERVFFEAVSGTSSGAINAALLVDGMAAGGRQGARDQLERFWRRISEVSESRQRAWYSLIPIIRRRRFQWSSKNAFYTAMHRLLVPYDYDRETMDPLRQVIAEVIDFPRLHNSTDIKLFVNATDICALKMRIFRKAEVTPDVLCASSCLPFLFQPVQIGQRYYWDGGFMGNPALHPLVYRTVNQDILLVQTSPIDISRPPETATEIIERMSAISFTATLMREIETIALQSGAIEEEGMKRLPRAQRTHLHQIGPETELENLGLKSKSKFYADWAFFERLRDLGRLKAELWLQQNFDKLGVASTVDFQQLFV